MSKVVIISGGSRGMGAAACRAFGEAGYTVVFTYNNSREKAEALEKELRAEGYNVEAVCCDVKNSDEVKKLTEYTVNKYRKIDVLVNNAGISHYGLLTDVTDEEWDRVFDTNIKGMFFMCREVLKNMVSNKSGRIINISSMWGICGASCEVVYSASKAAVIGLTKSLAKEVGPSGITVNCVAPGVIQTDMMKDLSDETVEALKEETPLGVVGQPEDVAQLVLYLASDKAGFITGQVISPNGGLVI